MPQKRPPAKQAAPSPNASRAGLAIGLACLGALAFAVSRMTSSPPGPPPPPSASAAATAEAPPPSPVAAASSAPSAPPRDRTYVGRQRCGECHGKQLQGWERDWHARALSPATAKSVVGDFKQTHFKGSSSEAWMT